MHALQLLDNRSLAIVELADAPAPGPGEVTVAIGAVALNHIDVWHTQFMGQCGEILDGFR